MNLVSKLIFTFSAAYATLTDNTLTDTSNGVTKNVGSFFRYFTQTCELFPRATRDPLMVFPAEYPGDLSDIPAQRIKPTSPFPDRTFGVELELLYEQKIPGEFKDFDAETYLAAKRPPGARVPWAGRELPDSVKRSRRSLPARAKLAAMMVTDLGLRAATAKYTGSEYDIWQIKHDASIEFKAGQSPFEIVSPVLSGQAGMDDLEKLCLAVNKMSIIEHESTGLHVHVGVGKVSVDQLRKIAQAWFIYEDVFDKLIAPARRGNLSYHAKSHKWCYGHLSDRQYYDMLEKLENKSALLNAFSPGENPKEDWRRYKVNLMNLYTKRTLEFRQHDGTQDWVRIKRWVSSVVRFVDALMVNPELARPVEERLLYADKLKNFEERFGFSP